MKGVVLAGGKGTRLLPLTKFTNKHLLPICDRPMIFYPLETLKKSGIREVLIVTDGKYLVKFKETVKKFRGLRISFATQKNADGIAGALKLAKKFAAGDSLAVVLGDNIFEDDFKKDICEFKTGARVFLKKVHDPKRFGIAELRGQKVSRLIEKPRHPRSDLAVVGLYFYDKMVFDIISKIIPSNRGELEITDVNNFYLRVEKLEASKLKGFWCDAGTFESLAMATKLLRKRLKK